MLSLLGVLVEDLAGTTSELDRGVSREASRCRFPSYLKSSFTHTNCDKFGFVDNQSS